MSKGKGGSSLSAAGKSKKGGSKQKPHAHHSSKKNNHPSKTSSSNDDKTTTTESTTTNRPRNFYVTDANHPFTYSFPGRFGVHHSLQVHQTAADASWPGGALWDLGVLLSSTLLGLAGLRTATTTTTIDNPQTTSSSSSATNIPTFKSKHHTISFRTDTLCAPSTCSPRPPAWISTMLLNEQSIVVELGCGVGLTGLVMAAVARPSLLLLTDLAVVIEHVTQDNLERNSTKPPARPPTHSPRSKKLQASSQSSSRQQQQPQPHAFRLIGQTPCLAKPLCWGDADDLQSVQEILRQHRLQQQSSLSSSNNKKASSKKKSKKQISSSSTPRPVPPPDKQQEGTADVILLGDVAYQHAPGAPSHFEALVETVLALCHAETILVFGTRVRMPASHDLLWLLHQQMDPLVDPPLAADEVDPSFRNVKHNMHIHFLKLKKNSNTTGGTEASIISGERGMGMW